MVQATHKGSNARKIGEKCRYFLPIFSTNVKKRGSTSIQNPATSSHYS